MLLAATAHASPFKDPLDTPAVISARALSSRLTAVGVADGRIMAVGSDGHILASDNGGQTWQQCHVPVSSDLVAVRLLTKDKAWAVGHDGVVLHTADGGKTWVKQLDGRLAAKAMQDYYERQAKAGDAAAIKMLPDVKRFIAEGPDKPFFDVLFLNQTEGFAVGAFNLSFRTRDGGKCWQPLNDRTENPQGLHLYGLASANGVLYLVGEQGLIRRWNREQERFEVVNSPYKGSFFGAFGKDSRLVVYGMRGNAFRSADGGATWTPLETKTTAGITSGAVLGDGRIVLTTYSGMLLSGDERGAFDRIQSAKPMAYAGVVATGADSVVLAGSAGVRVESLKKRSSQESDHGR
jgi:photosystem II stability/assembly factor-like uncharacterized protein